MNTAKTTTTATVKTGSARYGRRAALAGLAVTAVAVGLLATSTATAPDPGTGAAAGTRAENTAQRTTATHTAPHWVTTSTGTVSARVTVDGARIRTRPAPDGIILGLIPSGATLSVRCTDIGRGGDLWGEAAYQGVHGWVHASLWQPSQPGQQVPRCGTR